MLGWVQKYDYSRVNASACVLLQCAACTLHGVTTTANVFFTHLSFVDVLVENLRGLREVYIPNKCQRI